MQVALMFTFGPFICHNHSGFLAVYEAFFKRGTVRPPISGKCVSPNILYARALKVGMKLDEENRGATPKMFALVEGSPIKGPATYIYNV